MKKFTMCLVALAMAAIPAHAAVVWEGEVALGNWATIAEIPEAAFADAKEGDVIKINFTDVSTDPDAPGQVQLAFKTVEAWTWIQVVDSDNIEGNSYSYTITDAVVGGCDDTDLEMLQAHGLNIKGQNATVVSIELTNAAGGDVVPDAETTVWEGDVDLAGWSGIAEIPGSAFASAVEGSKVILYFDQLGETPQVQIAYKTVEAYTWTELVSSADIVGGKYSFKLEDAVVGSSDDTDLEMIKANGLNVKGQDAHLVKVCITVPGSESAVNTIATDVNAPVEIYTIDGRRVNKADKGLYIIRQGNKATKVMM